MSKQKKKEFFNGLKLYEKKGDVKLNLRLKRPYPLPLGEGRYTLLTSDELHFIEYNMFGNSFTTKEENETMEILSRLSILDIEKLFKQIYKIGTANNIFCNHYPFNTMFNNMTLLRIKLLSSEMVSIEILGYVHTENKITGHVAEKKVMENIFIKTDQKKIGVFTDIASCKATEYAEYCDYMFFSRFDDDDIEIMSSSSPELSYMVYEMKNIGHYTCDFEAYKYACKSIDKIKEIKGEEK